MRAGADEIDVGAAVDLHATQKERVDAALSGAVEEFPPAVGHVAVRPAAEHTDLGPAATALPREPGGGGGYGGRGPDRDTAEALEHPGDDVDEERDSAGTHSAARRPFMTSASLAIRFSAQYSSKPSSLAARRAYSVKLSQSVS